MSTTRTRVTAEVLRQKWFSPDAVGMTDNHQTGMRVVRMTDGTEYEAPLVDVEATP